MTEEKFLRSSFKSYQILTYQNDRERNRDGELGVILECMLLAVDFDNKVFKIIPIPNQVYEENEFWTSYENCEIFKEKPELKIK